jgi:DNA-binding transcriptional ArsR family regulator
MQDLLPLTRALADETRLHILHLLGAGEATVSDLVTQLNLPQPRVSSHLALLRRAGLVSVHVTGRQRTYRVDRERIQALWQALQALLPTAPDPRRTPSRQAQREIQRHSAIRQGRSCYDHLAGVAGVTLLESLLERGWLDDAPPSGTRPQYSLTPEGIQALQARGVNISQARQARRLFAYGCLDWTERRMHLGGALGSAILQALQHAGIIQRQQGSRTLQLHTPLAVWLDPRSVAAADRALPTATKDGQSLGTGGITER